MKYLFIVQGEGRGHLTQAISLSKMLRNNGHEVVEVLVGKCSNRELPAFFYDKIQSRIRLFDSPSIDYGKDGKSGMILRSIIKSLSPRKLLLWRKSVNKIMRRIEKCQPDVIVNFYDIICGVTNLLHRI